MNLLYNTAAQLTYFILQLLSLFNPKLQRFVQGRKESFQKLAVIETEDKVIWFHAASLGEFEQARPLIEGVKKQHTTYKIVVTFFSPSGYEIQKNYALADVICYLPFDTKANMRRFVRQLHPDLAILVKYEFWPNLLRELKIQSVPTILVSGIFRKDQHFFKSSGRWMRKFLQTFAYFFVQNQASKDLLSNIGFDNVMVAGDTRFDRVSSILSQDNALEFVKAFKNETYTVVAGSTWEEDEKLLVQYINASTDQKWIIAPHNINAKAIKKLKESIAKKTILYSEMANQSTAAFDVFIVDTIGLLTKIYSYADAVYVGGAFKTGLHNILEPATFGVPVVIGPTYDKFQEAIDLVAKEGCFSVHNQAEFSRIFDKLAADAAFRVMAGEINAQYIQQGKGAEKKIMAFVNQKLAN